MTPQINVHARLPYGLTIAHIVQAQDDFMVWLSLANKSFAEAGFPHMETMIEPAQLSGIVSGFMVRRLPKYCTELTPNTYFNGHPDLVPTSGPHNVQRSDDGMDCKASCRDMGFQGHSAMGAWLLGTEYNLAPTFTFKMTYCAKMDETVDWTYNGRNVSSRRTPNVFLNAKGKRRLSENWVLSPNGLGV